MKIKCFSKRKLNVRISKTKIKCAILGFSQNCCILGKSREKLVKFSKNSAKIQHLCTVFHPTRNTITLTFNATRSKLRMMQEHERNRPTRAHNATNKIQEHDRIPRFCTSCIASTYSGSLFRKRIHVTTLEKRKRLNFCEMKD